jgi:hypothetical protein
MEIKIKKSRMQFKNILKKMKMRNNISNLRDAAGRGATKTEVYSN